MSHVLEVRDLHVAFYTYYGVVRAVNGVNFHIDHNETLGIVGESGSGKSVTAAAVMGLIEPPGAVTAGEAVLLERNVFSFTPDEWERVRGQKMTMCFQNPTRALNPVLRIGDQMTRIFLRHVPGASKKDATRQAIELLKEVNIADAEKVLRRYPHQLSGGMCQRVMVVMALMCDPSLLILDEPTTGLDVTVQKQLLHLLIELREKSEASQWMITHDLGVIANLCDRVVVMYAGKALETASVAKLFSEPAHPYTRALLGAIPQVDTRNPLKAIPGSVPEALNLPNGCPFHPRCDRAMEICEQVFPEDSHLENGHLVACHLYGEKGGRT